jgi:carbon storage regulator
MLVLTRKQGQAIFIGEDIEVVVLEVRGDQVRLGIRAPRDVSVVRREIRDLDDGAVPPDVPGLGEPSDGQVGL